MAGGVEQKRASMFGSPNRRAMKTLTISWQRLVKDGQTCDRCGGTHLELQKAIDSLRGALAPLGFEPRLETQPIDEPEFLASPLESNRIWIAGVQMEDWLGARVGASRCCAACGDSDCRTVSLDDLTFETIPAALIVKATLAAAAHEQAGR
jgi:hypothetical protein